MQRKGFEMTIHEASKKYNIPIKILQEYESWGLCGEVKKVMGSWRYDDSDIERLSLIMTLHDIGFTNEEIKKYMRLFFKGTSTEQERIEMLNNKRDGTLTLVNPYSSNYNTVLDEAQRDQNIQARPELAGHVDNMDEYDTVMIGYPNWWASIPMPIASFLEEYDFSGKTILPFCSHGGGRFGQSLTAIAKLAPNAIMGEALSIHYSGGSELSRDVADWLSSNGIE